MRKSEMKRANAQKGWISAENRLPDHMRSVIGFVTQGGLVPSTDNPMIDIIAYNQKEKCWQQSMGMDDAIVTVTHWMPLPKPPSES